MQKIKNDSLIWFILSWKKWKIKTQCRCILSVCAGCRNCLYWKNVTTFLTFYPFNQFITFKRNIHEKKHFPYVSLKFCRYRIMQIHKKLQRNHQVLYNINTFQNHVVLVIISLICVWLLQTNRHVHALSNRQEAAKRSREGKTYTQMQLHNLCYYDIHQNIIWLQFVLKLTAYFLKITVIMKPLHM